MLFSTHIFQKGGQILLIIPIQKNFCNFQKKKRNLVENIRNMNAKIFFPLFILNYLLFSSCTQQELHYIEAESFTNKGGWVVDQQFTEEMGSPYLMAHGMGIPVTDAIHNSTLPTPGNYHVWARTKNWVPGNWEAPGKFKLFINGTALQHELGLKQEWTWEYAGETDLVESSIELTLHDLTGFNGRVDAVFLSTVKQPPPDSKDELSAWKKENLAIPDIEEKSFDLVITGGGIAGCAAAIAAAEQGLQVALIHDRPVLGGNASAEVRVHTLGIYGHFERILKMIDTEHYPNGSPEANKDQEKRRQNMAKYKNIHLYLNYRAYNAYSNKNFIEHVDAKHTTNGSTIRFTAPLFADCTGDGWIGYWAGAEYMYGRESMNKYNESWQEHGELWSPEEPDNRVMGSSLLWRSVETDTAHTFPEVPWAIEVAKNHSAKNGEWYWEYSTNDLHQADDAEKIRDHLLNAIYGSFYNEKQKPGNENLKLGWVSYVLGKRESRRLVGDYIYTFNDMRDNRTFEDSVVVESREVDVHYQLFITYPDTVDFLSRALFYPVEKYYIPYRSLYSKNVDNLFMAGRCFSCSHIGLGGPRVMRSTGQMGAAVGLAAALCKNYGVNPRDVYTSYLKEYWEIIEKQKNQN